MGVDHRAYLVFGYALPDFREDEDEDEDEDDEPDEHGCQIIRQSYYHEDWESVLAALVVRSESARRYPCVTPLDHLPRVSIATEGRLRDSAASRGIEPPGEPGWFLFVQVS